MRPNFFTPAVKAASIDFLFVTSRSTAKTLLSFPPLNDRLEDLRAVAITYWPRSMQVSTSSLPKPVEVPVIKNTFGDIFGITLIDIQLSSCCYLYKIGETGGVGHNGTGGDKT